MKICIPIESDEGIKSKVFAHFGGAPYFLIFDTDKDSYEIISNSDRHHIHGMCLPLKTLENRYIDVVICSGMGARAVQKLNQGNIKAFKVGDDAVEEIIKKYRGGILEEITVDDACVDHKCD